MFNLNHFSFIGKINQQTHLTKIMINRKKIKNMKCPAVQRHVMLHKIALASMLVFRQTYIKPNLIKTQTEIIAD